MLEQFAEDRVSLEPKDGKVEELTETCKELRERRPQKAALDEIMRLAGRLMFLCMNCFDKLARGGIQPFFGWLADNIDPELKLQQKHDISAALALGIDFFYKGLKLLKPRIYHLAQVSQKPILIYSDAEWTVNSVPPLLSKGLGGILWTDNKCSAAALDTPQFLVDALSQRETQIIPLELMAAAGMLFTYKEQLRGRDLFSLSITNQSAAHLLKEQADLGISRQ
jgi:hypothetical protein